MDNIRFEEIARAGKLALPEASDVTVTGDDPVLAAKFPIGETAAVALAACGAQAAELWALRAGVQQPVRVDVRAAAASLTSFAYTRVAGEPVRRAAEGNPCVRLYECRDGRWIHLHGAFPHLRDGTLEVLGCGFDANEIAAAVRARDAFELEDALAARGMCGAAVRTAGEWAAHPQAHAIAGAGAVEVRRISDAEPPAVAAGTSPLDGVRVLDLTRVLAGPTCGRTLAQHGADVLHIASPNLPTSPPFDIDTGHGKRSAWLDLDAESGPERMRELLRGADVFVEGFRGGALERRGFGADEVAALRPGIIYVSINCYGHEGPWRSRPGWEQLAQSVSGIAAAQGAPGKPQLVPAAACDYTTGYLAAYGTMRALTRRAHEGGSWLVRASLTQTAMWIASLGETCDPASASGVGDPRDLLMASATPFGEITHLAPMIDMPATPPRWRRPTVPLGTHAAAWEDGA